MSRRKGSQGSGVGSRESGIRQSAETGQDGPRLAFASRHGAARTLNECTQWLHVHVCATALGGDGEPIPHSPARVRIDVGAGGVAREGG